MVCGTGGVGQYERRVGQCTGQVSSQCMGQWIVLGTGGKQIGHAGHVNKVDGPCTGQVDGVWTCRAVHLTIGR
jgi:hypothetical protein